MNELPDGWERSAVADLAFEIKGSTTPEPEETYELYSVPTFPSGKPEILSGEEIKSGKRPVKPGDLLLCKINPRINRVWRVATPIGYGPQIASVEYLTLRLDDDDLAEYLLWYFRGPSFREWIKLSVEGATGSHTRAKSGPILRQSVPVPPTAEQKRIVAAIEELFTRLDVIEPALEGLLERLGVLRSAILADAFHANRDLPDGWEETTLEDLAASAKRSITDGPFGSNLKSSHYTDSGPRVIRLQNIGEGCFIDVHAHISEDHYRRLVAHNVLAEDLVVASLFSDRFRSCLIPEHVPPAVVKADCIRIRLSQEINPRFVNYALMRPAVDAYAVRSVHGVGRSRLGMKGVKSIPVPLPPHAEQQRIVEHIEAAFSRVDALEATVRGLLEQLGVFRRSVLAEAFAGRLVSQDPADEPASVLLERIQADRESGPKKRAKVNA